MISTIYNNIAKNKKQSLFSRQGIFNTQTGLISEQNSSISHTKQYSNPQKNSTFIKQVSIPLDIDDIQLETTSSDSDNNQDSNIGISITKEQTSQLLKIPGVLKVKESGHFPSFYEELYQNENIKHVSVGKNHFIQKYLQQQQLDKLIIPNARISIFPERQRTPQDQVQILENGMNQAETAAKDKNIPKIKNKKNQSQNIEIYRKQRLTTLNIPLS